MTTHRTRHRKGRYSETRWPLRPFRDEKGQRNLKLEPHEVQTIRRWYFHRGWTPTRLAMRYGVTRGHICNITARRRRADV